MTTKIFKAATFIIIAILLSNGIVYSQTKFWEPITSGPNASVVVMTITSNGDIWTGGENGVCLSTDNGNTWSLFSFFPTNFTPPYTVFSMAVNPVNGYIFASIGNGSAADSRAGLYRSTNEGVNWERVVNTIVHDILITRFGEIYVVKWGEGVFHSTDDGNTWQNKNNGLPTTYMVQCLTQGTDGTLYAGMQRVYRSTNGGDEWLPLSSSSFPLSISSLTVPGDGSVLFATSPYSSYYIGNCGVMKSTDGGITWVQIHNGLIKTSSLNKFGALSYSQKIVY